MGKLLQKTGLLLIALQMGLSALISVPFTLEARETDQYTLPPKMLEDIGPLLSEKMFRALEQTAQKLNKDIRPFIHKLEKLETSYGSGNLSRRVYENNLKENLGKITALRDPLNIARTFKADIGAGSLFWHGTLERWVESDEVLSKFAARNKNVMVTYSPRLADTVYHFSSGLWAPMYILRSPTIKVFGVEFGLDKLGHFINEGYDYFRIFRRYRSLGKSVKASEKKVVRYLGVASEGSIFGMVVTGVYSNADLAAQYTGMKFYRNLTESVTVGGISHPPIFDICADGTLRVQPQIRGKRKSFFSIFITLHFNEALNPSFYPQPMQAIIRKKVAARCAAWKDRYPGYSAEHLDALTRDLFLWHGEDYGHSEDYDALVRIGAICFGK